ncbi:MAG: hypothetical protein KJZ79_16635 [Bryobacteraceae bacterium]|nr:hypothetical protein [Bryobacteraceae bacterium]
MREGKAREVRDLETRVRDLINQPRWQYLLLQDSKHWNVLCAALDAVGDTTLAVQAYRNLSEPESDGERYLLVYGLLQALFLQQDCIENLVKSLGFDYSRQKELIQIRDVRNKTVGHPSDRGASSHVISRAALSKAGFTLLTYWHDGRFNSDDVDILHLIESQEDLVIKTLEDTIRELEKREMEHRQNFRTELLTGVFPTTSDYHLGKVCVGVDHPGSDRSYTLINLQAVASYVNRFRAALSERGILPAASMLENDLAQVEYTISQLLAYLQGNDAYLNAQSAPIFGCFLKQKIRDLIKMAEELDRENASDEI